MSGNSSGKHEDRQLLWFLIENQLNRDHVAAPPLPAVANQILMLAQDPNADITQLSRLIQQDQALAGKVLHMANSPAYLPQSPIVSLQQAITWLGLTLLAQLTLAMSVQKGVFTMKCYEKAIGELWRHALATGLYGKEIARRLRLNVENAFLCGLLHTIGKPFLLHLMLTSEQFPRTPPSWILMDSLLEEWHI